MFLVAGTLALNTDQLEEDKYPSTVADDCGILIAGVKPPEDTIGSVPVTDVTAPVGIT